MEGGFLKKEIEKDKKLKEEIEELLSKNLVAKYKVSIEDFSASLEPYYFWLLDFIPKFGYKMEKVDENMMATVTSAFFGEMAQRRMNFEKRGMEILGTINAIVKSIINLLYDLKELDRRLKIIEDLHSNDKATAEAADLALKRVFLDEVDVAKGNASINQMSYKLEFVTLRDAFMAAKKPEDIDKMDLNDRVKRIAKSRLEEYLKWREQYEKDLKQRKKIELAYLKSQVESLKLYSMWAGPYLKAAQMIGFKEVSPTDPTLVHAFDQTKIQLKIRGTKKVWYYQVEKRYSGFSVKPKAPPQLKGEAKKKWEEKNLGPAAICMVEVDFTYTTKPVMVGQRGGGIYRFIGGLDITFKGYAFTEEDYEKLKLKEDEEALRFIEGLTTESLGALREDLEKYLSEFEGKKVKINLPNEKSKKKGSQRPKSFVSEIIQSIGGKKKGPTGKEKVALELARSTVAEDLYTIWDIFKGAHGMKSYTPPGAPPPKPDVFTSKYS